MNELQPEARIEHVALRNFRNFERLELRLPAEGLVIVGDNGRGKTNLLESIYYFSLIRSGRGARDVDVTRFGADGFFIEAAMQLPDSHTLAIGFERAGRRKRVRLDGVIPERLSDALGVVPVVLFSPTDVELVSGGPGARRRFLDIMLAMSSRGYLHALQQYRAALDRRNAALRDIARKDRGAGYAEAEVWEGPLAEFGAQLLRARRVWVSHVSVRFTERCAAVGDGERVALRHGCGVDAGAESVEQALLDALRARRASDARHGLTSVGPHRDDLEMQLEGRELRTFGSAGQQRSAAIALRTLEAETLREARGASPVFLLDDPFAELDEGRAARVIGLLNAIGLGQTVLTVPRDSDVPSELTDLPRARFANGQLETPSEVAT